MCICKQFAVRENIKHREREIEREKRQEQREGLERKRGRGG